MLRRIADRSGGEYFRATDPEALQRVMEKLDPLERQEVVINQSRDYRELQHVEAEQAELRAKLMLEGV